MPQQGACPTRCPYNRSVPEVVGKYQVLREGPLKGFVRALEVQGPSGPGKLYWFEVHDPEARAAFFRYRNALKRLERLGALPQGLEVSAKPGRYYVFWPQGHEIVPPKGRRARRKLAEIENALAPLGYAVDPEAVSLTGGHLQILDLPPELQTSPARPAADRIPRTRTLFRWLPGFVLGLLGLALGAIGVDRYLNPPIFTVPPITGRTVQEALKALRGKGLEIVFQEESRPEQPAGTVLEVTPPPGTQIKPGRRIRLIINRPEAHRVPKIVGQRLAVASQRLEAEGYQLGRVVRTYDASPAGTVLATLPPVGFALPTGQSVDLLVSEGPQKPLTMVPKLQGLPAQTAEALVAMAKLTLGREEKLPSPETPGTVIAQTPEPGTVIEEGTPVTLTIAEAVEILRPKTSPTNGAAPPTPTTPPTAPPSLPPPAAQGPTVPIRLSLPPGLEGKPVRLTVTDDNGTRTLYEGPTQKGWKIEGEVPVKGKALFKLYVGDFLYQQWTATPQEGGP